MVEAVASVGAPTEYIHSVLYRGDSGEKHVAVYCAPAFAAYYRLSVLGIDYLKATLGGVKRIVAGVNGEHTLVISLVGNDGEGRLSALDVGVCQFLNVIEIDDSVGKLRPTVKEIPPDDTGLIGAADPHSLNEILLCLRLRYLRCLGIIVKIVGLDSEEIADLLFHKHNSAVVTVLIGGVKYPLVVVLIGPYLVGGDEFSY